MKKTLVRKSIAVGVPMNKWCAACKKCVCTREDFVSRGRDVIVSCYENKKRSQGDSCECTTKSMEIMKKTEGKEKKICVLISTEISDRAGQKIVEKNKEWKKELKEEGVEIQSWDKRNGRMIVKIS